MKKFIISAMLILSLAFVKNATAQVRLNVTINIGSQPSWGPVGYDYVEYYYLPDIQAYYYVPTRQFIYLSGSNWVFSYSLPSRYRTYNLYTGYKVVVNQPNAYHYFNTHKVRYAGYRGNHSQSIIRNSKAAKYKQNVNRGRGNGRGRGRN
jgi:hypothetical protein